MSYTLWLMFPLQASPYIRKLIHWISADFNETVCQKLLQLFDLRCVTQSRCQPPGLREYEVKDRTVAYDDHLQETNPPITTGKKLNRQYQRNNDPATPFTNEINPNLAKAPLKFNGRLAKLGLTS